MLRGYSIATFFDVVPLNTKQISCKNANSKVGILRNSKFEFRNHGHCMGLCSEDPLGALKLVKLCIMMLEILITHIRLIFGSKVTQYPFN